MCCFCVAGDGGDNSEDVFVSGDHGSHGGSVDNGGGGVAVGGCGGGDGYDGVGGDGASGGDICCWSLWW